MRSKTHSKGLQSLSWISELQIKKWQSALKEISKRAFEQFRPPERMTVSEWAGNTAANTVPIAQQGKEIKFTISILTKDKGGDTK